MLLPTSVVGSHGLPGWVWLAREAMEAGRLGPIDVRELMEDATQAALLDQERAGVDVVSTGEMMRVRFIIGFYDRFTGIRTLPAARRLGQPLWDTNTPFEVIERISAPEGLGIVDEFKLARSLTSKRIKATVPGPYTLLVPLKLGGSYRDKDTLLADLVGIVNAECRALVAAGADFIQIDEPHSGMYSGAPPRFDQGVNRAVEGIEAKIAVHVCFGNLYGRPFSAVRDFRNLYPLVRDLRASQIVLEFANRGMDDLRFWKEFPSDKELGAGVIDVKAFKAESPADVAERIREMLKHVRAGQALAQSRLRILGDAALGGEAKARRARRGGGDRPKGARRLRRFERRVSCTEEEPTMTDVLSASDLDLVDAYWRASNYLTIGQIYLLDNPLLREPLKAEHIKQRLLGHWGTSPGQNLLYVHLNRLITRHDAEIDLSVRPRPRRSGDRGPGVPRGHVLGDLSGRHREMSPAYASSSDSSRRPAASRVT